MEIVVRVLVLAVMATILAGLHWYVWRRLVRDTTAPASSARRVGTGVFVAGGILTLGTLSARAEAVPFAVVRVVATLGYLWATLLIFLLLGVLVGEIARPILLRLPIRRGRPGADTEASARPVGDSDAGSDTRPSERSALRSDEQPGASAERSGAAPGSSATSGSRTPEVVTAQADDTATDARSTVSRRVFVDRALAGVTAVAALATVAGGTYGVLRGPAVNRVRVPIRGLPAEAAGFRITLAADLHLGPALGRDFARKVVDTVNGTEPDLIAIAGDLVDGSVANLRSAVEPLAELRARHGVFFCMGNHEYYSGPEEWIAHLPTLGVRVLRNERAALPWFDIAGVDDLAAEAYGRGPDMAAALGGRDTSRPCVLLAHQPVLVHDAVEYGVDLQLSGHTHGGQIFPGNLLARLANPTLAGLERYGDTQLFVTRGAGAWGPPVRVAAPSDITVLELVPADS